MNANAVDLAKESSQRKRFALRRKFRLWRTAAIINTNAYAYPSFTLPLFLAERRFSALQKSINVDKSEGRSCYENL
jgi:hypothetical protein